DAEAEWADIMAVTRAARTLRTEYRIEPSNVVPATIAARAHVADFWRRNAELVGALPGTRLRPIDVVEVSNGVAPDLAATSIAAVAGGAELLIPAAGLFDVQTELKRTVSERANAQQQVERLERNLASDFAKKAPPETVQAERQRLEEQRERLQTLERRRETLLRLAQ
ncbi:MAG: hypothetical protein JO318_09115, partial [Chloroflexi bacterium]|nr:hypothetical protein [Chloroflexota bacterium]